MCSGWDDWTNNLLITLTMLTNQSGASKECDSNRVDIRNIGPVGEMISGKLRFQSNNTQRRELCCNNTFAEMFQKRRIN